ncbi:MAG: O-antigen ligase family protein [Candidatus Nealsonbacteria bacterium]|nr:O-antigen ligase family protein [Candidatus Nealsonbacteria bacterium]
MKIVKPFKIIIVRNSSYIPVIIFCLLLISPFLHTGLVIKQYTRLNEIFLIIVAIVILANNVTKEKLIGIKKIEFLLLILSLWTSISNLFGYMFLDVIPCASDFYPVFNILLFAIYFRLGTFFDFEQGKTGNMLRFLFITILFFNFISISQLSHWGYSNILPLYVPCGFLQSSNLFEPLSRTLGIMGNPCSFSIILVIILILLVAWIMYIQEMNKKFSFSLILLLLSTSVSLILTFSRTGFVALTISLPFLLMMAKFRDGRNISKIMLPCTVITVLIIILLLNYNYFFYISFSSLRGFRLDNIFSVTKEQSYGVSDLTNRIVLWKYGFEKAVMSPIFGWGLANASNIQADIMGIAGSGMAFYGPHNEYVDIFLRTGLVGLFLWLALFFSIFRKANRLLELYSDSFTIFISRSVQAILVALAVFDLADGFWFNATIPAIAMVIFGAMYGLEKRKKYDYGK